MYSSSSGVCVIKAHGFTTEPRRGGEATPESAAKTREGALAAETEMQCVTPATASTTSQWAEECASSDLQTRMANHGVQSSKVGTPSTTRHSLSIPARQCLTACGRWHQRIRRTWRKSRETPSLHGWPPRPEVGTEVVTEEADAEGGAGLWWRF